MVSADGNDPFGQSSCIACGTCLQVCPTGSLFDRRSSFMGRSELTQSVKSTCSQCSLGCGTKIVTRGGNVLRIEGDWDAEVTKGLLCQKGRFDPLYEERPRITQPLVRKSGRLVPTDWQEALQAAAGKITGAAGNIGVLTTSNATNEALYLLATRGSSPQSCPGCSTEPSGLSLTSKGATPSSSSALTR
jgi:formate dehydrogenase major subunit